MPKSLIARVSYLLIAVVVAAEIFALLSPLPALQPTGSFRLTIASQQQPLPWPSYGQAAIGSQNFGLLATNGTQKPVAIASVAKVITALVVLNQKPLQPNQPGPTITLGPADVANYKISLNQNGSVVAVANGEQISERQALESILLPSANNMASSIATWAFGSMDNFIASANKFVKAQGLNQTHIADASGFSTQTLSSAQDLIKVARLAMDNSTLAQIVAEPQATVPVAGTIQNINWLLGTDGIVGIKTGNTDEAGGCFLFAAKRSILGQNITILGAILGAPDLATSIVNARSLTDAAYNNFKLQPVLNAGQPIASYKSAWGTQTAAITSTNLSMLIWQGQSVSASAHLKPLGDSAKAHAQVGTVTATVSDQSLSVPVISASNIKKPSILWRLVHPY